MKLPIAGMDQNTSAKSSGNAAQKSAGFTVAGLILFSLFIWIGSQNASPDGKQFLNMLLFVLFLSIIILRWNEIAPLVFRNGG